MSCIKNKFIVSQLCVGNKIVSSSFTNKSATKDKPCVNAFVTIGRLIDEAFKLGFLIFLLP